MRRVVAQDELGASLLSYAALIGVIAVLAVAGISFTGDRAAAKTCQGAFGLAIARGEDHAVAYLNRDHQLGPQCCIQIDSGFGGGELCESDL